MKAIAILVVLSATIIIQWHSIKFWTEQTGDIGIVWSLCFEAAVMWLWWQSKLRLRAVGLIGTVVLLSGPLYIISSPVFAGLNEGGSVVVKRAELKERIVFLEGKYSELSALADKRTGWQANMDRFEHRLDAAYEKLDALPVLSSASMNNQALALFCIELLALLIITIAQVTAVRYISQGMAHAERVSKKGSPPPSERATQSEKKEVKKKIVKTARSADNGIKENKPLLAIVPERMQDDEDLPVLRQWLEGFIVTQGSIKSASETLCLDRREVGYARNMNGRKPKLETWETLRKFADGEVEFERKEAV